MKNVIFAFGGIFIILFSCVAGLFGGYIGGSFAPKGNNSNFTNGIGQEVRVTDEQSSIIDVANSATPSVVSIVVSKDLPKYYNDSYSRFFGNNSSASETERRTIGAGSGFVVNEDGLIITNRHVVDDKDASYTVVFNDGTKVEAKVLARDTILDIAFIKVEGIDVTPLRLGSSGKLKVGQTVIAIGNALGEFSNTVSSGIISGLSRDIVATDSAGTNSEALDDLIQTDASINPGNSGGPLLDIDGNVIGVNVAVAEAENIGFAIPIDVVNDLISRINTKGEIERPALGVRYVLVDETVKAENDLNVDYGALISKGTSKSDVAIIPNGPADKAGLKVGDVILEVDGIKINIDNTLQNLIQRSQVGDTITLRISRGQTELDFKVVLEKAQ